MKLAIAIRGHERNTMSDENFKNFINKLSEQYDADIFIHTWSLNEAKFSYRPLSKERNHITEQKILDYFGSDRIKKLIVEDDENIKLHGRTHGGVGRIMQIPVNDDFLEKLIKDHLGSWARKKNLRIVPHDPKNKIKFCFFECGCPILSWKRMWSGIYSVVKEVYECDVQYDAVLNTRFDILRYKSINPGSPLVNYEIVDKLINKFTRQKEQKILFLKNHISSCIDNIYVGTKNHMYELCENFHYDLDLILERNHLNSWEGIQENLVFLEAKRFSGNRPLY
jgi:hypothetical protein